MSSTQRYIGLDFGTTNSCLCYTQYNASQGLFEEPIAVRYGNPQTVRSVLLLDEFGRNVDEFGEAVYRHPHYMHHPERVREEFKLAVGKDPEAIRYSEQLFTLLLRGLQRVLNLHDLPSPDNFCTAIGAPAHWLTHEPKRAELLRRTVEVAGFPDVELVPEPVAAMLYHAFLGDIRFEKRSQRWLVIDFGGGTTDLAIVETAPEGEQPKVINTFGKPYGGKDFDQLLLEKHLQLHFWQGPPPNQYHRLELYRFIRQFKEKFSDLIVYGYTSHSTRCRTPGVINPVTLTCEEFQSESLAGPLIDRFSGILRDGFLSSGLGLRDIDRVILTGGSARWYFVRQAAEGFFGSQNTVISANPELTIAKGLALARTDFKLPTQQSESSTTEVEHSELLPIPLQLDAIVLNPPNSGTQKLDLEACRHRAQSIVNKYAAAGGAFALLVSPIPGVSQIPLTAAETKLVNDIGKIYGFSLKGEELATVVAGLLAGGTLMKVGVMEAATFIPGAGWAIKAGVAGTAIKLLGEAAIRFFEERRRRESLPPG